ncbi:MAG: Uma2 family endonuclease [Bryobacteraceae bacterium]
MTTATNLVTLEEYLTTGYSPDCDYVDDHIEERNLGEQAHSGLQREFVFYLHGHRKRWGISVWPEQRVQTRATRFRIPDVCVTLGLPNEPIFRTAPFLCIEIMSSEDRISRMELRIQEYLDMGVPFVWLVDPFKHTAWIYSAAGKKQVTGRHSTDDLARYKSPAERAIRSRGSRLTFSRTNPLLRKFAAHTHPLRNLIHLGIVSLP